VMAARESHQQGESYSNSELLAGGQGQHGRLLKWCGKKPSSPF
jgi:hypothetical protein